LCDLARAKGIALPKRRKVKVINHAVRAYQFSKQEIERILDSCVAGFSS